MESSHGTRISIAALAIGVVLCHMIMESSHGTQIAIAALAIGVVLRRHRRMRKRRNCVVWTRREAGHHVAISRYSVELISPLQLTWTFVAAPGHQKE